MYCSTARTPSSACPRSRSASCPAQAARSTAIDKAVAKGKITEAKRDEVLARIYPTVDAADAKGCDFVIEAVFESPELKKQVFAEIEDYVDNDALLGSNTSTLPITGLA